MTPSERKEIKPRKCKNPACRTKFIPNRPFIVWCSPECGAVLAKAKIERQNELRAKRARKEHKEAKERIKSRSQWMKEAQQAVNSFIRARDSKEPCISCGRHHQGQYHAGHFKTVGGNPELRFEELNIWKQCSVCNNHLHGNIINYRMNLIKRIGIEKVEWLEGPHEPKKYSIEELKEIKATYRKKANELLKGME